MLQDKGQKFMYRVRSVALLRGVSWLNLVLVFFLGGCCALPIGRNPHPTVNPIETNPQPTVNVADSSFLPTATSQEASPTDTFPAPSDTPDSSETSRNNTPGFIEAVGNWKAPDHVDGSAMTLEITHFRGNKFSVTWYDDDAIFCDPQDTEQDPLPWIAEGAGTATELTLELLGIIGKCVDSNKQLEFDYVLEYDPQTDTLTDNYDYYWERQ